MQELLTLAPVSVKTVAMAANITFSTSPSRCNRLKVCGRGLVILVWYNSKFAKAIFHELYVLDPNHTSAIWNLKHSIVWLGRASALKKYLLLYVVHSMQHLKLHLE
mmetsp:Transcript_3484/g.5620  ORF Transcript_3484/g.5620 Transcript_3484/m.5620 type:complete len:106 (+) Transcript_3484:82-399(+)